MNKKTVLFLGLFCLFFNVLKPISDRDAKIGAVAGGALTGAAVDGIVYGIMKKSKCSKIAIGSVLPLAGIGTAGLFYYFLYKILLDYTPQGRYLSAKKIVQRVKSDSLINREFKNTKTLMNHILFRFKTNWPLVLCRNHLENLVEDLNKALKILQKAQLEVCREKKLKIFYEKCIKLEEEIQNIFVLIEERVAIIFESNDYNNQVGLYEKHMQLEFERLEREKDRILLKQMHDKDIQEKRYDRDLSIASKLADYHQKEKDRNLKRDFLSSERENVRVNLNV